MLTGESRALVRGTGDRVAAGTVALGSSVRVRVDAVAWGSDGTWADGGAPVPAPGAGRSITREVADDGSLLLVRLSDTPTPGRIDDMSLVVPDDATPDGGQAGGEAGAVERRASGDQAIAKPSSMRRSGGLGAGDAGALALGALLDGLGRVRKRFGELVEGGASLGAVAETGQRDAQLQ